MLLGLEIEYEPVKYDNVVDILRMDMPVNFIGVTIGGYNLTLKYDKTTYGITFGTQKSTFALLNSDIPEEKEYTDLLYDFSHTSSMYADILQKTQKVKVQTITFTLEKEIDEKTANVIARHTREMLAKQFTFANLGSHYVYHFDFAVVQDGITVYIHLDTEKTNFLGLTFQGFVGFEEVECAKLAMYVINAVRATRKVYNNMVSKLEDETGIKR